VGKVSSTHGGDFLRVSFIFPSVLRFVSYDLSSARSAARVIVAAFLNK
jgi:hypothetical protein